MKKLWYLISMSLIFGLTACSDNNVLDDGSGDSGKPGVMSYVSVYADEDAKQPLIINAPLTSESTTLEFALANGQNNVWVQFPTKDGVKTEKMSVAKKAVSRASDPGTYDYFYRLEDKRYVELVITKPEYATPAYVTQNDGFTSYHSSGVVMFEDTWPSKSNTDGKDKEGGLFFGDYNDLVVDYDLETNVKGDPKVDIESAELWRDLKVVLHFRAMGGGYARAFGLKLENLKKEFVRDEEPAIAWSMSNHEEIEAPLDAKVEWDGEYPVIKVSGLEKLSDGGFMSSKGLKVSTYQDRKFYNTVNNENLNIGKGLFTVTVTFRGNPDADNDKVIKHFRDAVMDTRMQNFFLCTVQNNKEYEIHLPNYEPTDSYAASYEADKNDKAEGVEVAKDNSVKYRAADGNVWAFKTPVLTRHATERQNFGTAYPQYQNWLETGKEEFALWYLIDNANRAVDEENSFTLPDGKKPFKYIIAEW